MLDHYFKKANRLARFEPVKLFWIYLIAWTVFEVVFAMTEKIVWGECFTHWGDVILTLTFFGIYALNTNHMADFIKVVARETEY